jgi:hypothetical protein
MTLAGRQRIYTPKRGDHSYLQHMSKRKRKSLKPLQFRRNLYIEVKSEYASSMSPINASSELSDAQALCSPLTTSIATSDDSLLGYTPSSELNGDRVSPASGFSDVTDHCTHFPVDSNRCRSLSDVKHDSKVYTGAQMSPDSIRYNFEPVQLGNITTPTSVTAEDYPQGYITEPAFLNKDVSQISKTNYNKIYIEMMNKINPTHPDVRADKIMNPGSHLAKNSSMIYSCEYKCVNKPNSENKITRYSRSTRSTSPQEDAAEGLLQLRDPEYSSTPQNVHRRKSKDYSSRWNDELEEDVIELREAWLRDTKLSQMDWNRFYCESICNHEKLKLFTKDDITMRWSYICTKLKMQNRSYYLEGQMRKGKSKNVTNPF